MDDTVITEQDLIGALRPQWEFYVATGNKEKAETFQGIGLDLADRLAERNGWGAEQRKAFIRRLFPRKTG